MKKFFALLLSAIMLFTLVACENDNTPPTSDSESANTPAPQTSTTDADANMTEPQTQITLTVGDIVLEGYLNGSRPALSLIAQLPLTVTLNDSDNDFCGGSLSIDYAESDVQTGYKNGDLAFWTPANNFVIFVDNEELSANTGDIVILGAITSPQEMLDALEGTIEVTIALADGTDPATSSGQDTGNMEESEMQVRIIVGEQEVIATLEDNATTRAFVEMLPMTLPMLDLYGREMCYRFDEELPTDNIRNDGYQVGDLAYWPPRHSFVILYEQNGEQFSRQHLGHIDSGVEIFDGIGDVDVTFELVSE